MARLQRAAAAAAFVVASAAAAAAPTPIVLSDALAARPFYGVGAISGGGATSRLLYDYPEPQRSSLLDLLFSPQVGAAFQHQKAEVPGDADTTCGSEPSHRHDAADGGSFTRGYEGWLLAAAKARNPAVLTSALQWAAPRFVADPAVGGGDSLFTAAGAGYAAEWVAG